MFYGQISLSLHCTAATKLASQENRQGHVNAAYYCFYRCGTLDSFPAIRCRLFKRSNAILC